MLLVFRFFLLTALLVLTACTGNIQASSPLDALNGFYRALNNHQCTEAVRYRPDYVAENCLLIDKGSVRISATPLSPIRNGLQLFDLRVNFMARGNPQQFDGYVALIEHNGRWVIDSRSYEYKHNSNAADYSARYFSTTSAPESWAPPMSAIPQPTPDAPVVSFIPLPLPPALPIHPIPEPKEAPLLLSQPKRIVVDVATQQLHLYAAEQHIKSYPISTALAGEGSEAGSYKTPLGQHVIANKIGAEAPERTIFRARRNTGEIAALNVEGAGDLVTSRILWLRGLEPGKNAGPGIDSFSRYIYIHGTAEENKIGTKASHGCVRMYNHDVIELFDLVAEGTLVDIQATQTAPPDNSTELLPSATWE
jgi:lipoprotein-anchoring transpeptidase ErfK/SrfK